MKGPFKEAARATRCVAGPPHFHLLLCSPKLPQWTYCTASLFTSCNIFIMLLLQRKNWSSKSYTTSGCNIPQNINKTHTFQQIYNGEYSVVIGSYCLMDSNKNVDSHLVMIVLAGTVFFLHIHSLGVAFSDSQASHQHYYVLNKCC